MNLSEQVSAALRRASQSSGFDPKHDQLVVGVSGGPDSSALLHVLREHIPSNNLVVAHLDHGLRATSAADVAKVGMQAEGLRFFSERIDVTERARENRQSLEEAGRLARYEFLAQVANRVGAHHIAVGHHQDDQIETILMHFLRGSGPAGLRGMQEASRLIGEQDLWLLRPLLDIPRQEIEYYCNYVGLEPLIDESNVNPAFFRNRLRTALLPELETYNPQIRQRLLEMGSIFVAEEEALSSPEEALWFDVVLNESAHLITLNQNAWREQPTAWQRRLLRRAVAALRPGLRDVSFRSLEAARRVALHGQTGSRLELPGGVTLLVNYGEITLFTPAANLTAGLPQLPDARMLLFPVPGQIALSGGWRLTADWLKTAAIEWDDLHHNRDPWRAYVIHNAAATLTVRPRYPGEKMRPMGMDGERKLKEIMIDRKIPAHARARWPIVATDEHAVWVVGHLIDQRSAVLDGTSRLLRLRCLPPASPQVFQ
ncbi:MAG: tRNA lysidine(34) synthetase TilS [Anaerolineales bacterium]|uniref:tRNA lysidine(34) synthetase TilS n=1 Tax=Promineifilum sp. TaxID=2664178 RepID=UPI001DAC5EAC|nr:tRNA lysidine(34) synthetase TilS [Anaerolineales bacterium]MCO5179514.1 tRNA lysidine(34) synthetase TilS [Promineifilum sp.]